MSEIVPANLAADLEWYKPGPSILSFHASDARVRALIGGRGCGKTTADAVEVIGHGWHNAGAKTYILRKTQDSNEDTTLDTFEQTFRKCGSGFSETDTSLFKKIDGGKHFRIPSRLAVEKYNNFLATGSRKAKKEIQLWLKTAGDTFCSHIHFAGVPSSNYRATRFRGYECSLLIFVEADQLDQEDLDLGMACLRWKGSDPATCDENGFIKDTCVILDTNPPGTLHWIASMEKDAKKRKDETSRFWHIPTEENRANLPPNYIEGLARQYAKNPAMFARMLLGEYADAFDGKPVFFNFDTQQHVYDTLHWPKGAYLVRGWDFGTTHAVIWAAYWCSQYEHNGEQRVDEYWWDMLDYFAQQSDTERQCRAVRNLTDKVFPFWNDRDICSGVMDFCDASGKAKRAEGSSLRILNTYGFFPGYQRYGLPESLSIYNRILEKKDRHGNFIYRIDKTGCPNLYTASCGGYRYPNVGEAGYGSDEPLKGEACQDFDALADASRYAKMGCMRLAKTPFEDTEGSVGRLVRPVKVNRPRFGW